MRERGSMARNEKPLIVMPGQGIGVEVIDQVRRVVDWFDRRREGGFRVQDELFGMPAYEKHGVLLREEAVTEMREADGVLFVATGSVLWDKLPPEIRKRGSLLRLRKELELFA